MEKENQVSYALREYHSRSMRLVTSRQTLGIRETGSVFLATPTEKSETSLVHLRASKLKTSTLGFATPNRYWQWALPSST